MQAKGAAAAQQDRMDGLAGGNGLQKLAFPGGGAAAPDIQSRRGTLFAEKDSAASSPLGILRICLLYTSRCV